MAFWRDSRAASAAEFAMVLPVTLMLLFALVDTGRYMWGLNQIEKAAQMGARYAVVASMVPGGLSSASYVGSTACGAAALTPGDTICAAALGSIKCTSTTCSCETSPCPALGTYNAAAFTNIYNRMRHFAPYLTPTTVTVNYSGSGLGFAGDPNIQVAPIVTIKLDNVQFRPIMFSLFGGTIRYPSIFRSLTLEDGQGAAAD